MLRNSWKRRAWLRPGVVVALLALAAVVWAGPLQTNARAMLLISQVLPQVPVKPLYALTNAPVHTLIRLASPQGPIVADLFRPVPRFGGVQAHTEPALVLAMGVATSASDRTLLLSFAQTVSRLGYVVLWPRLRALDRGRPLLESPDTLVRGVQYLKRLRVVAPHRIAIMGFSVGASLGLIAATDPRIRQDVRALIFFAGYYDFSDYLVSIATSTSALHGRTMAWHPDSHAVGFVKQIMRTAHAQGVARIFNARTRAQAQAILRAAPPTELAGLRADSPAQHIKQFRTPIFILDDRGDPDVPYVQSIELDEALPPALVKSFLISNLFTHTHPKTAISLDALRGAMGLYGFLYQALSYV